ncbi:uncharacterized protein DUF2690 [Nonomuraea fuscirosea]|uniref:Uncharacterized protein DUF2690 n=1 Tax=Nonomuraea fuscirosea TaxID=1291556 RepID=A0A2T0M582_9ACTN|nr:DUF2690 domain-containing protein [Nonomuraea fuscirosea]PRX52647.1 uncharacterized protein DUF2690 [Nonomuraea fuscirosea]
MRYMRAVLATILTPVLTILIVWPSAAWADDPDIPRTAWYCGSTCNGTDPSSFAVSPYQVCADDATTPKSVANSAHSLTLQLRYSPYCRTVWGRIYGGKTQNYYISLKQVYSDGYEETRGVSREIPYGSRPYSWGWQWDDAGVRIKACVSTSWSAEPPWLIMCTAPY